MQTMANFQVCEILNIFNSLWLKTTTVLEACFVFRLQMETKEPTPLGPLEGACLNIKTEAILLLSPPKDGDISSL